MAEQEAAGDTNRFIYRNFAGGTPEADGGHGA
jgi:pyrroloquinoline quinone biosynthesis protein E